MLRYYVRHTAEESFQQLPGYTERPDGMWVHAEQPQLADIDMLSQRFALDQNTLRDILDKEELPHIEARDGNVYIFLRSILRTKHGEIDYAPLLAVLSPRAFVSVSLTNAVSDQKIVQAAHRTTTDDAEGLLLATFSAILADYELNIQKTGRNIKDIGHRLKTHEVNNSDFLHFVTIEDNLGIYSLNLTSMVAVAERLRENKMYEFSQANIESIDDIILHVRQLLANVQMLTQTVTSIRNAYSTIADNNLNRRMKTLTVLTVLIALPNVFYGMYGMNVALPFQNSPAAYGVIVGFTVLLILLVFVLAKRFRLF